MKPGDALLLTWQPKEAQAGRRPSSQTFKISPALGAVKPGGWPTLEQGIRAPAAQLLGTWARPMFWNLLAAQLKSARLAAGLRWWAVALVASQAFVVLMLHPDHPADA